MGRKELNLDLMEMTCGGAKATPEEVKTMFHNNTELNYIANMFGRITTAMNSFGSDNACTVDVNKKYA